MHRISYVRELLVSAFTREELRLFVGDLPQGDQVLQGLAPGGLVDEANAVLVALEKRGEDGRLPDAFWTLLKERRRSRAKEIEGEQDRYTSKTLEQEVDDFQRYDQAGRDAADAVRDASAAMRTARLTLRASIVVSVVLVTAAGLVARSQLEDASKKLAGVQSQAGELERQVEAFESRVEGLNDSVDSLEHETIPALTAGPNGGFDRVSLNRRTVADPTASPWVSILRAERFNGKTVKNANTVWAAAPGVFLLPSGYLGALGVQESTIPRDLTIANADRSVRCPVQSVAQEAMLAALRVAPDCPLAAVPALPLGSSSPLGRPGGTVIAAGYLGQTRQGPYYDVGTVISTNADELRYEIASGPGFGGAPLFADDHGSPGPAVIGVHVGTRELAGGRLRWGFRSSDSLRTTIQRLVGP